MLKEAIEKIQALADWPKHLSIGGKDYINGTSLSLLTPPALPTFKLVTLSGLAGLLRTASPLVKDDWLIHVRSHGHVVVEKRQDDGYGRRACLASCELQDGEPFRFGQFMDRELFTIALLSRFVQSADCPELLRITSSIASGQTSTSEDDGISQSVALKAGMTLKEMKTVKTRWTLQPFRTFREIEQPASEFVFRLQGSNPSETPVCALFEADGGKWKLDAVLAIKTWLEAQNLGLPVVA